MLLLASPFQSFILQKADVDRFMAPYATDLRAQKRDLEKRRDALDPFQKLNPVEEPSPRSSAETSPEASALSSKDTSSEWYVEEVDEGVDHYMFPRMMGYLVLEKQYELYLAPVSAL